jgi:Holliday junction resolvase
MAASETQEPARTTGYHQRGRAVEAMALDMLRRKGYTVVRSRRSSPLVHLVAWCDQARPVFVHVKRTRRSVAGAVDVASIWREEIKALQGLPRWDGMSVQLWVYTDRKVWWFYEVFPGGIAEVTGHVA